MKKGNNEIKFSKGNMSVQEAARALGVEAQTVRTLLQQKAVPWGYAVRMPRSVRYHYFISPKKFYEETGYVAEK